MAVATGKQDFRVQSKGIQGAGTRPDVRVGMDAEIAAALHAAIRGSRTREDIRTMQLLLSSLPPDETREVLLRALIEKSAELAPNFGVTDGQVVS